MLPFAIGLLVLFTNKYSLRKIDRNLLVTYTCEAQPLKKVLSQLSHQTNTQITCDSVLADDIMVIDVHQVKLSDLLAHIAKVEYANQITNQTGSGIDLTPNNKLAVEAEETFVANKKIRMEKYLGFQSKLGDQSTQGITLSGQYTKFTAAQKVMASLIRMGIAGMKPGDRWVFSNQPNQMQRPIPKAEMPIYSSFVQDHVNPDGKFDVIVWYTSVANGGDGQVKEYQISVMTNLLSSGETTEMQFYYDLPLDKFRHGLLLFPSQKNIIPVNIGTKQLALAKIEKGKNPYIPSKKALSVALNLMDYDPLTADGNAIRLATRSKGLQLVADLPDSILDSFIVPVPAPAPHVLSKLKLRSEITVDQGTQWEDISMANPNYDRKVRMNRRRGTEVYTYLSTIKSRDLPNMVKDRYYAFLDGRPSFMAAMLSMTAGKQMLGFATSYQLTNIYADALVGSLSSEEIAKLEQGDPILFSSLNRKSQKLLERLVFASGQSPVSGHNPVAPSGAINEIISLINSGSGNLGNCAGEVTDIIPGGLSPSTQINLVAQSNGNYQCNGNGGIPGLAGVEFNDANRVGVYLAAQTYPEINRLLPKYSKVTFSQSSPLQLMRIALKPGIFEQFIFNSSQPASRMQQKTVDFDISNMPASVRKVYKLAIQLFKQTTIKDDKIYDKSTGSRGFPLKYLTQEFYFKNLAPAKANP